jgi:magnesium transporter
MAINTQELIKQLQQHVDAVINQDTPESKHLWQEFIAMHPADIAYFFSLIDREQVKKIFLQFSNELRLAVFEDLSDSMKALILSFLDDPDKAAILSKTPLDEITDLFDHLSDEELKKYLTLLSTQDRQKVLSLLKFDPESAGGIMDTDVLTLLQNFSVEQSITILQRLQPRRELHKQIYVVDQNHILVGHIQLEDLVLKSPKTRLSSFMRENELVVQAHEDREEVAKKMLHYKVMTVPVVGDNNYFLGVISGEELVDVLVEEAEEDVQRMASLPPMKYPYFEMSFWRLFYLRGYVLVALMVAESFSGTLLRFYDSTMKIGILLSFLPILMSTGGNSGSQTSAVVIQGMASGEFTFSNVFRLLRREFIISSSLSLLLGAISFARAYWVGGSLNECYAIGISLAFVLLLASMLGNIIPFALQKLNIDPAFSAGPLLATFMDILSILIYCSISGYLLGMLVS